MQQYIPNRLTCKNVQLYSVMSQNEYLPHPMYNDYNSHIIKCQHQ